MSSGGFSKQRLARMHDVMARPVENGSMPGMVTLLSRRGETPVDTIGMRAVNDGFARTSARIHRFL